MHKVSNNTASGGLTWAQFVANEAGAKLYDYAVSGATCSNNIISRYFSAIKRSFPAVLEDEIPSFQADVSFKALYPDRTADNTVYSVWIGTNDLGFDAFLSDSQAPGTTITDYVHCVWSVFDAIYKTGGRRFVLMNNVPLELAPLYAEPKNGGTLDSQFWGNKTLYNATEYSFKIKQYSTTANALFDFGTAFQVKLKNRWPGAVVDIFDVHSLVTDIVKAPQQFLDAPFNTTGYFRHCLATNNGVCTDLTTVGPKSGFLWYDELHPSEKAGMSGLAMRGWVMVADLLGARFRRCQTLSRGRGRKVQVRLAVVVGLGCRLGVGIQCLINKRIVQLKGGSGDGGVVCILQRSDHVPSPDTGGLCRGLAWGC
ncbi:hypothetical protein QBC39DRAFT_337786 [Podospora conica]|nr:hypothetical protein QBC39DRAFT_337786 [Schizothecium conicum]